MGTRVWGRGTGSRDFRPFVLAVPAVLYVLCRVADHDKSAFYQIKETARCSDVKYGWGLALALLLRRDGSGSSDAEDLPAFSLAWSEYTSLSVFGVADELGLIDGKEGSVSEIEKKWKVDTVM